LDNKIIHFRLGQRIACIEEVDLRRQTFGELASHDAEAGFGRLKSVSGRSQASLTYFQAMMSIGYFEIDQTFDLSLTGLERLASQLGLLHQRLSRKPLKMFHFMTTEAVQKSLSEPNSSSSPSYP